MMFKHEMFEMKYDYLLSKVFRVGKIMKIS